MFNSVLLAMKETRIQKVYFRDDYARSWYATAINLEEVYKRIHALSGYEKKANRVLAEMGLNILNLAKLGHIDVEKFSIIDYGCGRSTATNVIGKVFSKAGPKVKQMLAEKLSLKEIMEFLKPMFAEANEQKFSPKQTERYGDIIVRRYDIGVPEYAAPPIGQADVLFCDNVFELVPARDLSAFIEALEEAGRFIFATISLRDDVEYISFSKSELMCGAVEIEKPLNDTGIVLQRNEAGEYIFSTHVSVFSEAKWQRILGWWRFLPALDYTSCVVVNFDPEQEYKDLKFAEIAEEGFLSDLIQWPGPVGAPYEKDPTLRRRMAEIQKFKHQRKLEVLKRYPDSDFKFTENALSDMWLTFINDDENSLKRLFVLDKVAKIQNPKDPAMAALALVADYVCGDRRKIEGYIGPLT